MSSGGILYRTSSEDVMIQPDLFSDSIINLAKANADKFPQDFLDWLADNLHVWDAFVREGQHVIRRGFKHYSAYTIVEFLRHHTAVSEAGSTWKINNNHRPYLARLFEIKYPEHAGLFEMRVTTKRTAA